MWPDQSVHFLSFRNFQRLAQISFLTIGLLVFADLFAFERFAPTVNAALPICTNSVSVGVYLDANADGIHEINEEFLAGAIQVADSTDTTVDSFLSPDGLFVLDDMACDEYTVYHNGDYVGKLAVNEVMGQVLIELPKTKLTQHVFFPLINQ